MAQPIYEEKRKGQTPTFRGLGGGSIAVDWEQQPSSFQQTSQILSTIMSTLEQEETKKQKKLNDKFDMYKTLRDAGYDTQAAYEAMSRGEMPSAAPSETTKEKKEKLDLTKTEEDIKKTKADTRLSEEKASAYARGDIGKRQSAADKMNAAQLQREIKRVSDPFENPDYDSEETKSYSAYLNQRLQQLSQYPGASLADQQPASGKIKVRRKSDGKIGSVSAKFFDPKKYEKA